MRSARQFQPVAIEARDNYRLWLRYDDGTEGEADLSHLAGCGVFTIWDTPGVFESVTISPYRAIRWSDEVELCADALYLKITGLTPEDIMPALRKS